LDDEPGAFELAKGDDDQLFNGESGQGGGSEGGEKQQVKRRMKLLRLIDGRMRSFGLELRLAFLIAMLADDAQNEEDKKREEEGFSGG
jgi:hypothetical protein